MVLYINKEIFLLIGKEVNMTKQELVELIGLMIRDKNHMINSSEGTTQQIYAWKYSRMDLESILNFVKELENQ